MPDKFNPNSPAVVGNEWTPTLQGQFIADSIAQSIVETIPQTVVETIGQIRVYLPAATQPTWTAVVVEVFDDDDASITLPIQQSIFLPNQTVSGTGATGPGWRDETGATANIHNKINDDDITTFIQAQCTINGGVLGWLSNIYTGRFNIGVGNLTGERILGVDLMTKGSKYSLDPVDLLMRMEIGGTLWDLFPRMANAPNWKTRYAKSLLNPVTFRPWLISEAETFDTVSEFTVRGFAHTPGAFIAIHQAEMHVYHVPETRLAVGGRTATFTAPAWRQIQNVVTPLGAAWTKDGTGEHVYVVRRLPAPVITLNSTTEAGSKSFTVRTLKDGPPPEGQGFDVQTESSRGTVLGAEGTNNTLFPLIQRTTAPADSVDSQPYVDLKGARVYTDSLSVSNYARQEFSNHITSSYGLVRCLVRRVGTPLALVVNVEDVATNTNQGSIGFLASDYDAIADPQVQNFDQLPDAGDGWRMVDMYLFAIASLPSFVIGAVPLAAGTQYYMQFQEFSLFGPGTGPDNYWEVAYLDTLGEGNVATFGGTTDAAYIDGGARDEDLDLLGTLAIIPDPVSGFEGVVGEQDLDGTLCVNCQTDAIEFAELTWTATALGAAFGHYEIERSDDGQLTWQLIASISEESTGSIEGFDDYEARRGIEACYRIRVVTSADIPSLWTEPVCLQMDARRCEFILVSNAMPELNLAYEPEAEKNYEFLDADETVFQPIYGRNNQAAFQPTENRGTRLSISLRVSCLQPTGMLGLAQFDAIRALSTAAIPYVTFLDKDGNRLFINLDVPSGIHSEPFASYVANVTMTQIADDPTPVEL